MFFIEFSNVPAFPTEICDVRSPSPDADADREGAENRVVLGKDIRTLALGICEIQFGYSVSWSWYCALGLDVYDDTEEQAVGVVRVGEASGAV